MKNYKSTSMKNVYFLILFQFILTLGYSQNKPDVKNCKILEYSSYIVAYDTIHCIPIYSYEILTRVKLQNKSVDRNNYRFMNDERIGCANVRNYYKSGYDKGHLTPAADNQYDSDAMNDCFYITNICPQKHAFNAGIWESLEKKARYWTNKYDSLAIYCGPVPKSIIYDSRTNLNVPGQFYKIIYSIKYHKAIAFIMNSDLVNDDIFKYKVEISTMNEVLEIQYDVLPFDEAFWK